MFSYRISSFNLERGLFCLGQLQKDYKLVIRKDEIMSKAVIYTRFSPRKNAEDSQSCEIQESTCRDYADRHKHEVITALNDKDVSGKDEYREKLWRAIELLPKGGVLIVYKRDRLARNVFLAEQINRAVEVKGATIEAVSGDVVGNGPEQVMVRQILASISEYERKLIGLRTSWAMKQHQRNGKRMGHFAPYGYEIDPEDRSMLRKVEHEQVALLAIKWAVEEEEMNLSEVVRYLNKEYPKSCRGKEWNRKTVKKIISRL